MKVVFKSRWLLPAAAALAAVVLRLLAIRPSLDSTDPVNFALALDHFNLTLHQPHFPGYPLYILSARAAALFADAPFALALPGALASAPLVLALYRAVAGRSRPTAGWIAAWLAAVAPPLVSVGAAPASDGLALSLATCAFSAALVATEGNLRPSLLALAGLLFGITLGVRPSYAPLAPSLFLVTLLNARRLSACLVLVSGACAGLLAWLGPFAAWVGPRALRDAAATHLAGHFDTWGGSVITSPTSLGARALALTANALAGLGIALALAALSRSSTRLARRHLRLALTIAALAAPYAAWAWLAQNVAHARHAAPLTLLACTALGLALAAPHPRVPALSRFVPSLAIACTLFFAIPTIAAPPPSAWRPEAVRFIDREIGLDRVLLVGTHLPRVANYYQPALRTDQASGGADVARIASSLGDRVTLITSSELPDLDRADLSLEPLAHIGDATLYRARARLLVSR